MFSAVHFVSEIQIVWFCPESTRHASANAAPLDLIAGKIHVDGKGRRPPAAPLRVMEDGTLVERRSGTPQGGVMTPRMQKVICVLDTSGSDSG